MKWSKLNEIVREEAYKRQENAAYGGLISDGGSSALLKQLSDFKQKLVFKYDLRPSEYDQLNDKEVGEPNEFYDVIRSYKLRLADELVKTMKL